MILIQFLVYSLFPLLYFLVFVLTIVCFNPETLIILGAPTAAGYLTQGPSNKLHVAPPPVDIDSSFKDGF